MGRPRKPLRLLICSTEISPAILWTVDVAASGPVSASVLPILTGGPVGPAAAGAAATSEARLRARRARILPLTDVPLRDHTIEEPLRWPFSPPGDQPLLRRDQVRAVLGVQAVGVRPVLVHPTPRVRPVVVDLAPEEVPSDSPHVLVLAELSQMLVPGEHVVDVRHFERHMVQAGPLVPDAEVHVMVDVRTPAIEPVERADDVVFAARVHIVRADEPERFPEPPCRLHHLGRRHHAVADPL